MEARDEEESNEYAMTGTLHITFPEKEDSSLSEKSKKAMDNAQKAEDENKKLITNSNILTALRGAFAAYGKMNQKQFEHIVDAFTSSI